MIKKILLILVVIAVAGAFYAYHKYEEIFAANIVDTLDDPYLYIPTGATFDDVLTALQDQKMLLNESSFVWVAEQMNYKDGKVRAGRFKIKPGWSNRALLNHLRGGKQATVSLVLTNERLIHEVAGKAARFIEADSVDIAGLLSDRSFIQEQGYSPETLMSLFIPNTYDFFWNSTPTDFFDRMVVENQRFWGKNKREQKAEELGLSKAEVYTLASIVERETNKNDEKQRIAGVYLNRLDQGILLQADPTVVFANGDFGIRRVLKKHLAYDSPYNTYKYKGLPPGPISMASIASLDAVLNAEDHDYLFFCAKPDQSGYHAFAKTLRGHNVNAAKYRKWVSSRNR